MNIREITDILVAEGFTHAADWAEAGDMLIRAIGLDYIKARRTGSGVPFDYTTQDVRRAVAQLRLNAAIGAGESYQATKVHNEVRNIAMHHEDGIVVHDGHEVYWTRDISDDTFIQLLFEGNAFVAVPCWIESLASDNFGTVALQTEED